MSLEDPTKMTIPFVQFFFSSLYLVSIMGESRHLSNVSRTGVQMKDGVEDENSKIPASTYFVEVQLISTRTPPYHLIFCHTFVSSHYFSCCFRKKRWTWQIVDDQREIPDFGGSYFWISASRSRELRLTTLSWLVSADGSSSLALDLVYSESYWPWVFFLFDKFSESITVIYSRGLRLNYALSFSK